MNTLDNVEVKGKRVFVRIDMNSPYDEATKKIEPSERIKAHAETIRELAKKGAKVIVLAHQGRKGDVDCISLEQHAQALEKFVKRKVTFVDDIVGEKAKRAISSMRDGWIVVLDNVRFLDDETKYKTAEEYSQSTLVKELGPLCDLFVLDAFSVAHRAQASVVGLGLKGGAVAGRVMQRELEALDKVSNPAHPVVFVMGGAKPDDSIVTLEKWLSEGKVDTALTGGVLGSIMVAAKGKKLGASDKYLEDKKLVEFIPKAKELLEKYGDKIAIPKDVAVEIDGKRQDISIRKLPSDGPILDIGKRTTTTYKKIVLGAKTIVVNGPMGVYEKEEFEYGTKKVFKAIEKASKAGAFSLLGGGHTISALAKFKIRQKNLGYVSLAGKALIAYLNGDKLPGVEMLKQADSKPDESC